MKHVELKNLQPKWLDKRTILLAITGSHAYGTNTVIAHIFSCIKD